MSRQDTAKPAISKIGSVRPIIQVRLSSSRTRASSARPRPMRRAVACCASGSRAETIERKMMLSMPSTISSTDRVARLIQAWGSVSSSSMVLPSVQLVSKPVSAVRPGSHRARRQQINPGAFEHRDDLSLTRGAERVPPAFEIAAPCCAIRRRDGRARSWVQSSNARAGARLFRQEAHQQIGLLHACAWSTIMVDISQQAHSLVLAPLTF